MCSQGLASMLRWIFGINVFHIVRNFVINAEGKVVCSVLAAGTKPYNEDKIRHQWFNNFIQVTLLWSIMTLFISQITFATLNFVCYLSFRIVSDMYMPNVLVCVKPHFVYVASCSAVSFTFNCPLKYSRNTPHSSALRGSASAWFSATDPAMMCEIPCYMRLCWTALD